MSSEKSAFGTKKNINITEINVCQNNTTISANESVFDGKPTVVTPFQNTTPISSPTEERPSAPNASNVHRLLEFYRALAPVCIGGPSSTTLELELSGPPHALAPTKQQVQLDRRQNRALENNYLQTIPSNNPGGNHVVTSDVSVGNLPKVDIGNKLSSYLYPSIHPSIADSSSVQHSQIFKPYPESLPVKYQPSLLKTPKYTDYANNFDDSKTFNNDVYVRDNTSISPSFTSTSHSLSSASRMFSLYNNLQTAAAAQAAHQAAQAVAANASGVTPQPLPIPPPSSGIRVLGGTEGSSVESAQNRLFCHQLYERMRAVQQSMTMAMAVNMASSPTGFVTPVGGGPAISSQNPAHQQPLSFLPITSPNVSQDGANQIQYVPAGQSSKYPASQPSNIGTGSTINNIRHSRKRRANSNATESGSTNISSNIGSRSSANHLSGDMIRRLRQQQQKLQEPKTKSITSTSENSTSSSSVVSLDVSVRNTSYQPNYTTSSPLYSHALGNINEDGQAVSYSRPPPLIEIESPLKGLSKLTTSGVVAPPNAIAPSSEQSNRDINTQYNIAASLRLATSKANTESRLESPTYSSSYQRSRDEDYHLQSDVCQGLNHSSESILENTIVNGETIPGFNTGGELRLCLPRILRQILGQYHWEQICLACEELQIHCAPCTSSQLAALKVAAVIPSTADQCGLITKSDTERLTSYLNTSYSVEKDKESSIVEDGLATTNPICRKRLRNASSSIHSSSPTVLPDSEEILTNSHSQESSRIDNGDEYNPSLKKSKEPCSETDTIAPSASNYRNKENSSASNMCMEAIQCTPHQQMNTTLEQQDEETSEAINSKPTEHKIDKKNELEKPSESNNSPSGFVCDRDAKDNKLIKHVSNHTSENISSLTSVSSEKNKFIDKTKDVAGQTTANKKNEQLLSADDVIHVQHECFGKAWGRLNPKLYISPDSKCIKCVECSKYFSPRDFILHLHPPNRENQTCHWGFDISHWRSYLHIQHEVYIQKDLNRYHSDTSTDNGSSTQPYHQYLMMKRGKRRADLTKKQQRKKDNRFEVDNKEDDDSENKRDQSDDSCHSPIYFKETPLQKERSIGSEDIENGPPRYVLTKNRVQTEDEQRTKYEQQSTNKSTNRVRTEDKDMEQDEKANCCDKETELFIRGNPNERKTYFLEAALILEEVKNRFLPPPLSNQKDSSKATEERHHTEWERENSEKYDGPDKSYMPESRSWPKYERKEYRQNEQNQHIRKPHQIIFPENNYFPPQSNQSSKNVKDVEIGIDMSPSLQLRSISRADDDSNPYMVNDGAVRSPSTLTFRPWGGSNKSKEGEERIPFSPQINQSSLDAPIPKDDYRGNGPPSQGSWNKNRDRLIQESALLSRELVASIGDLSTIQQDYGVRQKSRGRTSSSGSSPLYPHSLSIDHPSAYVKEVKASLAEDRGLSARNRDFVTEILDRLAERVTSAELSRNVVVGELVTLRERFQVLEAELSKKCEELRHLFILQQRGRPIGSGGSSFHSGVGHSSGDSSNTANIACHFLPDRKGNDSPIIEARCKIYENSSSIQGTTSANCADMTLDTGLPSLVSRSTCDNLTRFKNNSTIVNEESAYKSSSSSINKGSIEHALRSKSYQDTDFHGTQTHLTSSVATMNTTNIAENDNIIYNGETSLHKSSMTTAEGATRSSNFPFLTLNSAEGNNTQRDFMRIDIAMSPGGSSSNDSRSPHTTCEALSAPTKNMITPDLPLETYRISEQRPSPTHKNVDSDNGRSTSIVMSTNNNNGQTTNENTSATIESQRRTQKEPTEDECSNPTATEKPDTKYEEKCYGESDIYQNPAIAASTSSVNNNAINSPFSERQDKDVSQKSGEREHESDKSSNVECEDRSMSKSDFQPASKAHDDQLKERMLNIESELRSLRSELEERNRIFKSAPNSSQQDKPKTVDKCKDADNEGVIPELRPMSCEITKSENQSPLEANLLPENDSDSSGSYDMEQKTNVTNDESQYKQRYEKIAAEQKIHSSKSKERTRLEEKSSKVILNSHKSAHVNSIENRDTSWSSSSLTSSMNTTQNENVLETHASLDSSILQSNDISNKNLMKPTSLIHKPDKQQHKFQNDKLLSIFDSSTQDMANSKEKCSNISKDTSVFEKTRKGEKEENLEEANDIGSFSHDAGDNTSTRT